MPPAAAFRWHQASESLLLGLKAATEEMHVGTKTVCISSSIFHFIDTFKLYYHAKHHKQTHRQASCCVFNNIIQGGPTGSNPEHARSHGLSVGKPLALQPFLHNVES